jgi:hypothetical protein
MPASSRPHASTSPATRLKAPCGPGRQKCGGSHCQQGAEVVA